MLPHIGEDVLRGSPVSLVVGIIGILILLVCMGFMFFKLYIDIILFIQCTYATVL